MPSAARSVALRLALVRAVRMTAVVRSQISSGLCSTQPARGRIWSCSSWCSASSLPPWSKIMKRVLVVPWSTAPTKSVMSTLLLSALLGARHPADLLLGLERQDPADECLVEPGAQHAADQRRHDGHP